MLIFKMRKKGEKGQFYLIAAVIIIIIISGLITAANSAIVQPRPVRFYDLSEDYGAETSRVIDYGKYNVYSPDVNISKQIGNISEVFAKAAFIKDPKLSLVYIFGNNKNVWIGNTATVGGEIRYCISSEGCTMLPSQHLSGIEYIQKMNVNTVNVSIAGQDYIFDLTDEENFYFIIQTTTPAGEKSVVIR
jgi:hypothetical protein